MANPAPKPGYNAYLRYQSFDAKGNGSNHFFFMWVSEIEQKNQLNGSTAQSRRSRQFYPKTFSPGDYEIEMNCASQEDYQFFARYVRAHQLLMVQPGYLVNRFKDTPQGFQRLMQFSVPSENIDVRGWIEAVTLTKKGVFEPAPEVTFSLHIAMDSASNNVRVSSTIKDWMDVIRVDNALNRTGKPAVPPFHRPSAPGRGN